LGYLNSEESGYEVLDFVVCAEDGVDGFFSSVREFVDTFAFVLCAFDKSAAFKRVGQ
jgi:hypothetical protein